MCDFFFLPPFSTIWSRSCATSDLLGPADYPLLNSCMLEDLNIFDYICLLTLETLVLFRLPKRPIYQKLIKGIGI